MGCQCCPNLFINSGLNMKIVVQAILIYITFNCVVERNELVASKIPRESFLEKPRVLWNRVKKCFLEHDGSKGIRSQECSRAFSTIGKDEAEARGLWSALKALLSDKTEAEAEKLFNQLDSTKGLWSEFKQCLMDQDQVQTRGIWTSFKTCLRERDDGASRGIWSAMMALLKDKDEAEVKQIVNAMVDLSDQDISKALWTALSMLLNKATEDEAKEIIEDMVSIHKAQSRLFWSKWKCGAGCIGCPCQFNPCSCSVGGCYGCG